MASPERTARVIEWNGQKGYGFLENGGSRLFLHIRDFADRGYWPRIGDLIRFRVGYDREGRACAVDAKIEQKATGPRISFARVFALLILLVLPALAIRRFAPDLIYAGIYLLGISVATWFAYAHDKNRAKSGGWRVAEAQLHLLELVGGWPAAFLAQRWLRHKSLKPGYQFIFWLIVFLHQFAALDSLLNWKFSSIILAWFGRR